MMPAQSFDPEPDLHPLYPTVPQVSNMLASHAGLDPSQKAELVAHCLKRACLFGDVSIAQYLLSDPQAQVHVDLGLHDEDGTGLVTLAIHGFGGDSDRDVEREECVRFLVSQGADLRADTAGWTPLHHAAVMSPPTLVSYLMTHGCSPFDVTRRNLTPLDLITAHSILPGREDVALLLEEAMRGEGWTGGRMEHKRRLHDRRAKRKGKRKEVREDAGKILGVNPKWWQSDDQSSDSNSADEEGEAGDDVYTPLADYGSMLVFSQTALPQIFDSLITNFPISLKNPTPANTLYLLARFACLTCDHTWLEELITGAADAIEEAFFNNADDLTCLVFWLYNTTLWLHLMECDTSINEACEMLGSFDLIEEIINSIFVFIIRFSERKIDQLLDSGLLDFAPSGSESELVQFESEWSFLRPFTKKKAPIPVALGSPSIRNNTPSSPPSPHRPLSPSRSQSTLPSGPAKFSSLRQTFARAHATSNGTSLSSLFTDAAKSPSPYELTSFLTALHTILVLSDINPVFTTQLWSQVFYWTSCEIFNRIITRKKYICRSRAQQISVNLRTLENWIDEMGIPPGVQCHFAPVRDLLSWLQSLSSITEFPDLVLTIQSLKNMNPLQMRRAVRDYRYEINEERMNEECVQYITQLQKDWERHRIKIGVEALRKEIVERKDREGSISTIAGESTSRTQSISGVSINISTAQQRVDVLLDKMYDKSTWEPPHPPQVLGELLDSRFMLPLLFPSNPRLLGALPSKAFLEDGGISQPQSSGLTPGSRGTSMEFAKPGPLSWSSRDRKIRERSIDILQWVDGVRSASRWWRRTDPLCEADEDAVFTNDEDGLILKVDTHVTPLTRKPSGRSKGRLSNGGVTPIDAPFDQHNTAGL